MPEYFDQDQFPAHDFEINQMVEALASLRLTLPELGVGLDMGGARGQHASRIAGQGRRIYVTDVIPYHALAEGAYIQRLVQIHARHERAFPVDRLVFIESDAQNMLFKDNVFDFAYSINTFEHIPNPFLAFDEMMRVLKPDGMFYIQFDPTWTSPFGHHLPDRLPEPWTHLISDQTEVHRLILANGGTEDDVRVYDTEMNRRRLGEYFALFNAARHRFKFDRVQLSWWPTSMEQEPLCAHPNFAAALAAGYGADELFVRGMRFFGRLAANR